MTHTPLIIMLAAAAALAGCNKEDHTIVAGGPQVDNSVADNGPVALPPSITASKVYRCANNAVLYINWMSDGSATVRNKPDSAPTAIAAGSADLKGDANAKTVTYHGESCKA